MAKSHKTQVVKYISDNNAQKQFNDDPSFY